MTNQQILDEQFLACTSRSLDELRQLASSDRINKYQQKFSLEEFKERLIPHKMEEFSEPLYLYMILELKKHDRIGNNQLGHSMYSHQNLVFQDELVVSLKELLSGGQLNTVITNIPKNHIIQNKEVKNLLFNSAINSLSFEIKKLGLNRFPIAKEDAIVAINNHIDIEWIKNWMESDGYAYPDYQYFTLENFDDYFETLHMSNILDVKSNIKENLISEFAFEHPEEVHLDIKGLDRIIKRIREEKSRPGRKQEIGNLKYLAFTLSCLIRVDRYLEDHSVKTIIQIPVTNADCRFIHDVMAFFGLINDYSKHSKTLRILEPRIKKMLKDLNDVSGIVDVSEKLTILKFS